MVDFLKQYGVLISIASSFSFLVIGWYVVLNSTKYITSRNECRTIIEQLNSLLDDSAQKIREEWSSYDSKSKDQRREIVRSGVAASKQIRRYRKLLLEYGLEVLPEDDMTKIKEVMTLEPSKSERIKLTGFITAKLATSDKLFERVILDNSFAFLTAHKPTHKPLLEVLRVRFPEARNYFLGALFGSALIALYFYIGTLVVSL
ncbi:hypothetical protein [Vibrio parahaemolyticus]|uniref:hypothetical protein n=1 Tax=Vibrio parahaemolyticus TaxID=670 RepID=UPI001123BA90|nr:hypothetical protein [Vibrio parahaemolyticus]TPB47559.1 hypothetical protein DXJ76_04455 [Vibrio parahaemolyticus]